MTKTMCELKDPEKMLKRSRKEIFVCKGCKRIAGKKKHLCKPEKK
jgi:hypothetical protein